MIGKRIGQYQVIEKIGEGGMGAVYKAEDTTLHRFVALKTISGHLSEDEEAQERFVREAQSASSLNHPNITTVFEFLEDEDTRLICMEYVEGKTIRDMVETGIVSVRKAIDIILQAAGALETAHNKGILHRDVKSANIMVSMEGQVKVMDFGLAHVEDRSQLTRTGTTMGTLSYSSPEQITGKPVDRRSEVFSLGVVFYELLTGQLPFRSTSEAETAFEIINTEPEKLTKIRDDVPELLEAVVSRMLEKDADLRYPSCGELIKDLKGIRAQMETSTVSITGPLELVQARQRKTRIIRLTSVAGGVVIVAAAVILVLRGGPQLDPNRIVVAVFENRTGDESLDPLGSYVPSSIQEEIDRTHLVMVVPFNNSLQIHRSFQTAGILSDPVLVLAEQTRAGIAISGSYYLHEGKILEFKVEIRDVRKGDLLAAVDPVMGPVEDRLDIVERLCHGIMGVLGAHLDPEFSNWTEIVSQPPSYEAFQNFTHGLEYYFQGERDVAIQYFYQAAAFDTGYLTPLIWAARMHYMFHTIPRYATADSLLSIVEPRKDRLLSLEQHHSDWLKEGIEGDNEAQYIIARTAARQAPGTMWSYDAGQSARIANRPAEAVVFFSEIDPGSTMILQWTGYLNQHTYALHMLGEHKKALKLVEDLIRRQPNPQYQHFRARALISLGRMDEVMEIIHEFKENPAIWESPGWAEYWPDYLDWVRQVGYWEDASELITEVDGWYESRPAGEKETEFYRYHRGRALYQMERWEEAYSIFSDLLSESPESVAYHGHLGCLAARRGDREEALRMDEWLASVELRYRRSAPFNWRSSIASLLGDKERAVTLLKEAYRLGRAHGPNTQHEIDYESMSDYGPFLQLLQPPR